MERDRQAASSQRGFMPRAGRAALAVAVCWIGLANAPTNAAPRCAMSCQQQTADCIRTRCAALSGQPRDTCVDTCRGIGGCARIGTLAYVLSTCTDAGFRQRLQIRRGNCDPVSVLDFPEPTVPPPPCARIGAFRWGTAAPITGVFQRLGVSPTGEHVVFEVTDDFSLLSPGKLLPPEQQGGIFAVRADGRGLRRLGPPSRDPSFGFQCCGRYGLRTTVWTRLTFSPDGREVVLTDLGPGPAGEEAVQVFTLNVDTGERIQLTHLPFEPDHPVGLDSLDRGTCCPVFLDNGQIVFLSYLDIDGSNPEREQAEFVMNRDGSGVERAPFPLVLPEGRLVPIFETANAGSRRYATTLSIQGTPINRDTGQPDIREVFLFDNGSLLQLTTFGRSDTGTADITRDGRRVIFAASADPFGTNPTETCQLFSIDTVGTSLRQLTDFSSPELSPRGCVQGEPPGCRILSYGLERATGTEVFYSSCDPFGTNPYGDQLFAIGSDGRHLRQLTRARGLVTEADGTVIAENLGPIGHSGSFGQ